MESLSENILVIHDSNPVAFKVWLFAMIALFVLYFLVATIRDINRERKIELLRQKHHEDGTDHSMDDLDI